MAVTRLDAEDLPQQTQRSKHMPLLENNMASSKLGDLNVTEEELERLSEALKNEEFRKLFAEYAEEISNPENRKRYEEEIAQLEREKGVDVKFVHPTPGYVLKTSVDGSTKAFVNVCQNEHIGKPSSERRVEPDGRRGMAWRIPHSLSPVRDDVDKNGGKCKVIDFVLHPDTYRMGESNGRFREMIHDTLSDTIKQQLGLEIDRKNLKLLKMKFKGTPEATVIRRKQEDAEPENLPKRDADDIMSKFPYPYGEVGAGDEHGEKPSVTEKKMVATKEMSPSEFTAPKYTMKHRSDIDMKDFCSGPGLVATNTRPKELVVEVELPLLKSAASVTLDIFEKRLILQSIEQAKYKLDIALPYAVDENEGCAKFDKAKRKLIITLPVILAIPEVYSTSNGCEGVDQHMVNEDHNQDPAGDADLIQVSQEKPLIERMSLRESSVDTTMGEDATVPGDVDGKGSAAATAGTGKVKQTEPSVPHSMPEFCYNQTDDTLTIIMQISNVQPKSVTKTFCPDQKMVQLRAVSVGQGGFPIYYQLCIGLPEDLSIDLKTSHEDVSPENVVFVFMKSGKCQGMWNQILIGPDPSSLQEKLLLTEKTIIQQLDALDEEHAAMPVAKEATLDLEVTEMNSDKLTVEIKDGSGRSRRKKRLSESAEDIEVVHDKQMPKLHGILKQRSRTLSESSDDIFSVSVDRQNSSASVTSSEGLITESDDSPDCPGRKKSVSFSEQVDQTTYKTNNSVSSMHSTLKNKRRRARKKEQKLERQHQRRTRRSSGGSEPSSDEHNLQDDDDDDGEGDCSAPLVNAAQSSDQNMPGVHNTAGNSVSKKVPDVNDLKRTSGGDVKPAAGGRDSSTTGSGVVSGGEVTCGSGILNGTAHADVGLDSRRTTAVILEPKQAKPQGSANGVCQHELGAVRPADSNLLELSEVVPNEGTVKLDDAKPAESGPDESGSVPALPPNKTSAQLNGSAPNKPSAETALSWKEPKPIDEHKTKCAIELSNNIIFDLDAD